ncbi:hypothetical protein NDU88_001331 [Pleurodeles waltl]|uniref:Uncharacterized protein n=1 Tax=Pleurodeles waltl TaxID=8319 RepID=A0AAV7LYE7_PLEWA|nr:hypothetical protein NDU88_001331 [Pleurodeles waltl]
MFIMLDPGSPSWHDMQGENVKRFIHLKVERRTSATFKAFKSRKEGAAIKDINVEVTQWPDPQMRPADVLGFSGNQRLKELVGAPGSPEYTGPCFRPRVPSTALVPVL